MSTLGDVQALAASFEALARWEIHIKEDWRINPGDALPMAGMISGPVGDHLKRWSVQQVQSGKEYHRHQRLEREIETTWKAYVDTMGAQLRVGVAVDLERLSPADLDALRVAARQLQGYATAHPPVPVPTTTLDPNAVVHRGFDAIADLARTDPEFAYLDDVVHDRFGKARAEGRPNTRERIDRVITATNPLGWVADHPVLQVSAPVTLTFAEGLYRVDQTLVAMARGEQLASEGSWLQRFLRLEGPVPELRPVGPDRPAGIGIDPTGEIAALRNWARQAVEAHFTNQVAHFALGLAELGRDLETRIAVEQHHQPDTRQPDAGGSDTGGSGDDDRQRPTAQDTP